MNVGNATKTHNMHGSHYELPESLKILKFWGTFCTYSQPNLGMKLASVTKSAFLLEVFTNKDYIVVSCPVSGFQSKWVGG